MNNSRPSKGVIKCYACNKTGHYKKDCRSAASTKVNLAEIKSKEVGLNMITINLTTQELFKIEGKVCVNPLKSNPVSFDAQLAFDSGATASIIGLRTVRNFNINLEESDKTYRTADNTVKNVEGVVKNCLISFKDRSYLLDLICIDHKEVDILLGLDWFEMTQAGIIPYRKEIVFTNDCRHYTKNRSYSKILRKKQKNDKYSYDILTGTESDHEEDSYGSNEDVMTKSVNVITAKTKYFPKRRGKRKFKIKYYLRKGEDRYVINDDEESDSEREFDVLTTEIGDDQNLSDDQEWTVSDQKRKLKFELKASVTEDEKARFEQLIERNKEAFAKDLDELGECELEMNEINLTSDCNIYIPAYRRSISERKELKKITDDLKASGIIRDSLSKYSSPSFLVPKKDGTKRMVTDFRMLNKVTVQQRFPLPKPKEIFDRMSQCSYFSTLDLKSGYWQIKVNKKSMHLTAFSTPDGHFEYIRMPFGLKNSPAEFCRIMHHLLIDLDYVSIYLDDITIHSKTFEEHLNHIQVVLDRLKKANLKLNPEKCEFGCHEVSLLGHIVSGKEIKMDPKKIEAITKRKPPTNVKTVQVFLGLTGYYRMFIPGYANIVKPLTELLRKEVRFEWLPVHQQAFDDLISKLASYPILRQPNFDLPFILHTDASTYAIGVILAQVQDGMECIIECWARLLKGAELNYSVSEKECLGVIFGCKKCRVYLIGTTFIIVTDHYALLWLMTLKDPQGRLARWSLYVQMFTFKIVHRKGKNHCNADAISRPNVDEEDSILTVLLVRLNSELNKNGDIYLDKPLFTFVTTGKHIEGASKKQIDRVTMLARLYKDSDQKIWYKSISDEYWLEVPEPNDRKMITENAHLLGHFGINSTYERLKERYYWYKMIDEVKRCIQKCEVCQRNQKVPMESHPAKAIKVNNIFDRVGIDLVFGFPESTDGYVGVCVITEYLTGRPYVKPIKSKTAEEIASIFWEYCCLFGPPKSILSDQGNEFCNSVLEKIYFFRN